MARFNANRVSYKKQDQMMDILCKVLSGLKTPKAINDFLKDLLNRHERLMLIRRLLIAELLLAERTYEEIQEQLHVGSSTIARIDRWLHFGRGGYKNAINTLKKQF